MTQPCFALGSGERVAMRSAMLMKYSSHVGFFQLVNGSVVGVVCCSSCFCRWVLIWGSGFQ